MRQQYRWAVAHWLNSSPAEQDTWTVERFESACEWIDAQRRGDDD